MKKIIQRMSNRSIIASVLTALLVLPIAVLNDNQNAVAHIWETCTLSGGNTTPKGNEIQGSTVWVAIAGTGKLLKYPTNSCSGTNQTFYTVGGDPTYMTWSGTSRLVFTQHAAAKIGVFRTDTFTLERNVALASSSYRPYDIHTDRSDSNKVWFTLPLLSTPNPSFGSMVVSTGSVTYAPAIPQSNAEARGIRADTTYVFITDTYNNKVWRYTKNSNPAQFTSEMITGKPYFIMVNTAANDLWGTVYDTNKIYNLGFDFSASNPTYFNGQSGTSNAFRIKLAATDAMFTYRSGHVAALHMSPPYEWHAAWDIGTNANDVTYDTSDPNWFGWQATGEADNTVVRGTHFPD